jgi:hypothetical protein
MRSTSQRKGFCSFKGRVYRLASDLSMFMVSEWNDRLNFLKLFGNAPGLHCELNAFFDL